MANILIIGATSAIASTLATNYAEDGHMIYCLARSKVKMQALASRLGSNLAGYRCFDFTNQEQVMDSIVAVEKAFSSLDVALIAHGDLFNQQQSENDFNIAYKTISVNFVSAIAFLLPLRRLFCSQGHGKIAVITSVAGDRGRPRNYTYGAAKGALTLYLQGLRSQLWPKGIKVYTIKLGPVDTPMTVSHQKNFSFTTVENASSKIRKALDKKKYEVYIPGYWYWVMMMVRSIPEQLFQRLSFLKD